MDEATIEAARRGERAAQARLLSALQDVWYRYALSQLRDPDRAADATQETGLRFLKQIGGFRGESQLTTWSLGIALNVVREMKRRRFPELSHPEAATAPRVAGAGEREAPHPARAVERMEAVEVLKQTLQQLPDRQREAIVLRFFEDLSVEQAAAAMGCAAGTVKATVHQALRALKQRMSGIAEG
ncbi:MAG TPA: RNA polymerase sigma factor [Tepidisphaeraceae bacterium]|nr:RNA polymerase sigma factor [Tepidisphaeraceae bacterium]